MTAVIANITAWTRKIPIHVGHGTESHQDHPLHRGELARVVAEAYTRKRRPGANTASILNLNIILHALKTHTIDLYIYKHRRFGNPCTVLLHLDDSGNGAILSANDNFGTDHTTTFHIRVVSNIIGQLKT